MLRRMACTRCPRLPLLSISKDVLANARRLTEATQLETHSGKVLYSVRLKSRWERVRTTGSSCPWHVMAKESDAHASSRKTFILDDSACVIGKTSSRVLLYLFKPIRVLIERGRCKHMYTPDDSASRATRPASYVCDSHAFPARTKAVSIDKPTKAA